MTVGRVVIVGASGNIGTALLRRLTSEPDVDVVGICRRPPPPVPPYDRVGSWRSIDVADPDSEPALAEAFGGADVVVHLAWGFQPTRRPAYLESVALGGTSRVVRAVRRMGVPRLVHMSSVGAYAPRIDLAPVDETYPVTGVPTSLYSRHKAAAERLLDAAIAEGLDAEVVRIRPGFVVQRPAGASLARYGLPPWLPRPLLGRLPVVPLPTGIVLPVVHSDDVADGVWRAATGRTTGAFNLVADPPLPARAIADVLGRHPVAVPAPAVRAVVDWSWRLGIQPIDVGWYDLAMRVPMLSAERARRELDWTPTFTSHTAFAQVIDGIAHGRGVAGRVLGPRRSLADVVSTATEHGTASRRRAT